MKKILLLCLSAILAMAAGAATVTGKVVSPSKAPVAGATILFLNGDDSQFSATDDSGVFTIQNAVAGTYFLVIQATGYPEYQNPEVVVGDTDLDLGEIELEVPTYSLNGRVYVALPTGNAELPGALVSVKYVENGETKIQGPQSTLEDGSFLFEGLPLDTEYEVTASHDMNVTKTVTVEAGATEDFFLDIVLEMITDGVTVTGELVNDLDQPVLNGMIRFCIIQPDGSLGSEYIISCEDTNEFVMENMQPNTAYRVIITAPDYAEKVIEKFEVGEEDIDMGKISLGKSLGIESVWSDDSEAPVYYNLQGQRITSPEKGQIVICRRGSQAAKVVF